MVRILAEHGIKSSTGSVGDSYDNALAESVNSLYKTELIHTRTWHDGFVESFHNRMRNELLADNSIENLEHARTLVTQWSRRYNNIHPHSSLDYLSPRKYAEQWRQENTVNA